MGLAGNMKLSTFVVGMGTVGVVGGIAGFFLWPERPSPEEERAAKEAELAELATLESAEPLITPPVIDRAKTKGPPPDEPTMDDALFRFVGTDLGTDKKKDVLSGAPYKINVYQDAGELTANRAKIDLDRDELWDMKVSLGDTITRKVSTNDDEAYDIEETWDGQDWVIDTEPLVLELPADGSAPPEFKWVGMDLGTVKIKDAAWEGTGKANVYQDPSFPTANRVKIDLDRDDKWDIEVMYGPPATRAWSTRDDGEYDVEQTWRGGIWFMGTAPADLSGVDTRWPPEFGWKGRDLGTSKVKDASWAGTGKLNVYQDDGEATANRAKIDLDRDDKWDIKITYGDPNTRLLSSADDENYDVEQIWSGTAWE
ncbi:MAG: hypothetical protein GY913_01820 [Proteobacteria bacterium]|nr:hypothetical protein [Pseudomonadota bacterium]MCP4915638.1 hypothetical protein [Pseudomonadota bacterium]